jgi:peroxiredoxin
MPSPATSASVEVTAPAVRVVAMDPPAQPGALAPNLHAADGAVLAVWLEPIAKAHRLQFARWTNAGWTKPVTIVESTSLVANWADTPSVVVGGDGALVAHWAERAGSSPYAYHAVVGRSIDGGATWQRLGLLHDDRSPTEHGFVSLVADGAGVRAFWLDGRATGKAGGATSLRTAPVGEVVGTEETVDDRVCDCCGTAAANGGSGAVVVYRDRDAAEIRDIWVAGHRADAWQARTVHSDGWRIAGCPVNGPAIAGHDGRLAVAWYTYAKDIHRVRVAFSTDSWASFGRPFEVDGPRDRRAALGRVAVVLADDGSAIVSWMASQRDDAMVLVRRISPAGELGAEVLVATTVAGRDAGFARMVRDGSNLVLAWTDPRSETRLRAARLPIEAVPRTGAAPMASMPTATGAQVGMPAPALSATTLSGDPTSLAALRGRVVLLNVWATWCEPCRQELPELAELHRRVAPRGAEVIAVSVDRERSRDEVNAFVTKRALPFAVWLDPDDRISSALGVATLPATILIDREGTIRWRHDGAVRAGDRELLASLERALEDEGPDQRTGR